MIKPTLNEEKATGAIASLRETIEKNDGKVVAIENMGIRKLAYKIDDYERGNYQVFYFELEPASVSEIERIIRINEDIIRFLTVKYESKNEAMAWDLMIKRVQGETVDVARLGKSFIRKSRPKRDYSNKYDNRKGENRDKSEHIESKANVDEFKNAEVEPALHQQ